MRWVLQTTIQQSRFWALQSNNSIAQLRYNREAHSLRLDAGDKRLFFIERSGGFLQNRFVLKTEYSVPVGEAQVNKHSNSGWVVYNNEKFNYAITGDQLELTTKKGKLLQRISIEKETAADTYELMALMFALLKVSLAERAKDHGLHGFAEINTDGVSQKAVSFQPSAISNQQHS